MILVEGKGVPGGHDQRKGLEVRIGKRSYSSMEIGRLEGNMRPRGNLGAGYLGRNESLLDVIEKDKAVIAKWIGSREEAQIDWVYQTMAHLLAKVSEVVKSDKGITVNGELFYVGKRMAIGAEKCPFEDRSGTNKDYYVVNAKTGETLQFSGLIPHLIGEHHFFEGEGTSYRVAPRTIIEFFNLAPLIEPAIAVVPLEAVARYNSQFEMLKEYHKLCRTKPQEALDGLSCAIDVEILKDTPPEAIARFHEDIKPILERQILRRIKIHEYLPLDDVFSALDAALVLKLDILPPDKMFPFSGTLNRLAGIPGCRFSGYIKILLDHRDRQAEDSVIS